MDKIPTEIFDLILHNLSNDVELTSAETCLHPHRDFPAHLTALHAIFALSLTNHALHILVTPTLQSILHTFLSSAIASPPWLNPQKTTLDDETKFGALCWYFASIRKLHPRFRAWAVRMTLPREAYCVPMLPGSCWGGFFYDDWPEGLPKGIRRGMTAADILRRLKKLNRRVVCLGWDEEASEVSVWARGGGGGGAGA